MKAKNVLLIVVIMVMSSVFAELPSTLASIPKPSTPEFSLKFVAPPYDVPTKYEIDPYTGENITHPGVHYEWQTLDFTIKNQPFTPTRADTNRGTRITSLLYDILYKGHFAQEWHELFGYNTPIIQNSTLEFSVISFLLERRGNPPPLPRGNPPPSPRFLSFPSNATVDFQVKTLNGYFYKTDPGLSGYWVFVGKEIVSETQTLTIP